MHVTPLLSWDFVHVGALAWTDERKALPCDVPRGVELRVEPATKSEPILARDRPWEQGQLCWAQVMADEGRYRMWYGLILGRAPKREVLCYAESEDGVEWHKPELGIVEVSGSVKSNIVFAGPGAVHFSVAKCPHEPPDKRYRCMYFKSWFEGEPGEELDSDEGHHRLDVKNAAKPGESVPPVSLHGKMLGMDSPDGLHWTPIQNPILDEWHDTHNICTYDEAAGVYRAYLRGFYGGRRAISYSETKDFERWPSSRVIHHCNACDAPDESLYSNGYTRYPGRPDLHLLFPAVYHQSTDTVYGQLAVSRDGVNWSRLSRQAIVPIGGDDEPDGYNAYPEPDLLRFRSDGKFRMLYHSSGIHHNEWYNETLRDGDYASVYRWAEWGEDRLAGVHAADEGELTIAPQACGDRLLVNFRAEPDGWVRFELVDRLVWPPQAWPGIEGHRFEDMQPMTGDQTHAPVAWRGSPDLSSLAGKAVAVRVKLRKATLFSTTMYGVDDPLVQDDPRYPV